MEKRIIVIGSTNTDMVVSTPRLPVPGETVLGGTFLMNPGGKGANQAVAAARLGGNVVFVTKVGDDLFGRQTRAHFEKEGLSTRTLFTDPNLPSGVALITVDDKGENCIVVAPGANGNLSVEDLSAAHVDFRADDIVLMQLEIPLDTVVQAATMAMGAGARVILNPAPATNLPASWLKGLFLLTPNRSEAEVLSGVSVNDFASMEAAARVLHQKGVENVVITLGKEGAFVYNDSVSRIVPTLSVTAVDTTAAGDVFNGALSVALCENRPLEEAIAFANRAAALSVTRMGAQASAPYRKELQEIPS